MTRLSVALRSHLRFTDVFRSAQTALALPPLRLMGLYQHPHLTRGVVHTPEGAFHINRGLVELPDELGESLGWAAVPDDEAHAPAAGRLPVPPPPSSDASADRSR